MILDNSSVRRQDRLLDDARAKQLLETGEYGVLSMVDAENSAYGIPFSFVWDSEQEAIYFHCAPDGHKLECLKQSNKVSFCIVGATKVVSNKFTTAYESLIVRGLASYELDAAERMHALELLLDKYSPNDKELGLKYTEKSFHRTKVLRLSITSISGKSKRVK